MNNLTEKSKIKRGAILKTYTEDEFEGWARLLEKRGEPTTFINGVNTVYVKENWLVEFVSIEEVPKDMTPGERLSQKALAGFRTHRWYNYFGELTWGRYVMKYGPPKEIESEDPRLLLDDENFIF